MLSRVGEKRVGLYSALWELKKTRSVPKGKWTLGAFMLGFYP